MSGQAKASNWEEAAGSDGLPIWAGTEGGQLSPVVLRGRQVTLGEVRVMADMWLSTRANESPAAPPPAPRKVIPDVHRRGWSG